MGWTGKRAVGCPRGEGLKAYCRRCKQNPVDCLPPKTHVEHKLLKLGAVSETRDERASVDGLRRAFVSSRNGVEG